MGYLDCAGTRDELLRTQPPAVEPGRPAAAAATAAQPEHDHRRSRSLACVGRGRADGVRLQARASACSWALCYLPLVLVNLPLGIALWVPTTFLTGLPGFDTASHAAGLVIALAWLGTLGSHAHEQGRHVPRGLLLLVAVFIDLAGALDALGRAAGHVLHGAAALAWRARSCSPC